MQIISCLILNCSHLQVRSSCCSKQTQRKQHKHRPAVATRYVESDGRRISTDMMIWIAVFGSNVESLNSISKYVKQKHFKKIYKNDKNTRNDDDGSSNVESLLKTFITATMTTTTTSFVYLFCAMFFFLYYVWFSKEKKTKIRSGIVKQKILYAVPRRQRQQLTKEKRIKVTHTIVIIIIIAR